MKYRNFAVATWSDDIVLSMSPEQKLVFIYLYTSPYTSSCGIFKLSLKTAGFQLGYTGDPFESALKGLCSVYPDFVAYDPQTGEVALLQYPKQLLICATGKALIISQKEVENVESQYLLRAMIAVNSAGLSAPYLAQLRRLQMKAINDRNANAVLCGDVALAVENEEVSRKIEIESKVNIDILSFSVENDGTHPDPVLPVNSAIEETPTPRRAAAPSHVSEIIAHLNEKTGGGFRPTTKPTITAINARMQEGYTIDDFKAVIDCKSAQWKGDAEMSRYLRPETLFCLKHFESYLNELKTQAAANTDAALKDMPEATSEQAEQYAKFVFYLQEKFPALWRSNCRLFSMSEYFDYMENKSLPGVVYNMSPNEKRAHLTRILTTLATNEQKRKRYATLFDAYSQTMRAILNNQKSEL